jgi:hypothetical protein
MAAPHFRIVRMNNPPRLSNAQSSPWRSKARSDAKECQDKIVSCDPDNDLANSRDRCKDADNQEFKAALYLHVTLTRRRLISAAT